ncbi:hypothetical protein [Paraburkholderia sp. J67]|uniref:hypothetical protein n=1 Tax=Paraburkholderia sp. J67 TaxID=2805435 RepID=UPI002ABD1925|nr:hypothetical protein [Paraburkholderia sp. J67]
MQVTTSTSSQAVAANAPVNAVASKQVNDASTTPESSTKVTLSDEGLQKSAEALSSADSTGNGSASSDTTNATNASSSTSSLKSVTYGVLGLPDPTQPQPKNTAFGVGKVIAAIGTVVSIAMLALKFL